MTASGPGRSGRRTVLHVLPHPGGGGETYVDTLSNMEGYQFTRVCLAPSPKPLNALTAIPRSAFRVLRAARAHDVLHVHGEVGSTICLPSLATRPSVVTLHGLNLLRRMNGARRVAAKANLRLIVRASCRTICVSENEHGEVVEAVGSAAAKSVVVIRNGLPPFPPPTPEQRAAVRAELAVPESTSVVLYVGQLEAHKDPLTAVRAAREAVLRGLRLRLVVVGDGLLRAQVEREGGGVVDLLGSRNDVQRLLAAADLLVLPSLHEGLPYVVLEAMAAGVVPVVADAPGSAEAVGGAGVVAPVGDVGAFADAYVQVLSDEGERKRLASRGRERVARDFAVDEMISRTLEVYDAVLRERPRRSRPTSSR
jgi:glycosyltransferase involved in cell wall biosynthesis